MRMTEKYHQTSTGVWSGWPQTREDAEQQNTRFYHPTPCVDHCHRPGHGGEHSTLIYTKTGIHHCCTIADFEAEYFKAIDNAEPTGPEDANNRGYDYYWVKDFSKHCGHLGRRTLDGKCYDCAFEKAQHKISPRQKAIDAGERFYISDKPCKKGHIGALTRVANSECQECAKAAKMNRDHPAVQDLYPEMVIDPETAKSLGFKVYRTGESCKHGHTGWRYITTKACIQCLRGKP